MAGEGKAADRRTGPRGDGGAPGLEIREPLAVKAFVDQIREMEAGPGILGGNNALLVDGAVSS